MVLDGQNRSAVLRTKLIYSPHHSFPTLNDKTTYGAKDCWSTLWSGDYGVNWRFCSGTVKTTDITSGTYAAEISTLAFYNKDVNGAWKEESVYNYTRDNGTASPGLLFLGSVSGETGYYTLGVDHNSRPDSFTFDYKYTPIEGARKIIETGITSMDEMTIQSTKTGTITNQVKKQVETLDQRLDAITKYVESIAAIAR